VFPRAASHAGKLAAHFSADGDDQNCLKSKKGGDCFDTAAADDF